MQVGQLLLLAKEFAGKVGSGGLDGVAFIFQGLGVAGLTVGKIRQIFFGVGDVLFNGLQLPGGGIVFYFGGVIFPPFFIQFFFLAPYMLEPDISDTWSSLQIHES